MINDRNDPMHQGGALRTRSKRLAIAGWDSYPHPKVLMSVAIRVRVRQAAAMNKTTTKQHRADDVHLQIRDTEKRPKTMLVTSPQNR